MKSGRAWLVVGVIIILVAGAIWFATANKDSMPSYTQSDSSPSEENTQTQPAVGTAGTYVPYNAEVFANTEGQRWLFFHAGWCPQCRALEEDINKNGVPDGITIFKVNYDTETELKKKYGVTLQTTVVEVDASGNKTQSFVAYDDPTLQAVIDALGS